MDNGVVWLTGALALAGLAAIVTYKRRRQRRARRVTEWVTRFLLARYGRAPHSLSINCSDDASWPVLVACDDPSTGIRHRLRFACGGPPSTFSLVMDTEEPRP